VRRGGHAELAGVEAGPEGRAGRHSRCRRYGSRLAGGEHGPHRLTGHSGGGSFLFGYIDAADDIPAAVDRIVFLDANYSYSDTDKHGDKLVVC